jgi:hypothetical protein
LQLIAPGQAEIIYRKNTGPVEAARIDETIPTNDNQV